MIRSPLSQIGLNKMINGFYVVFHKKNSLYKISYTNGVLQNSFSLFYNTNKDHKFSKTQMF